MFIRSLPEVALDHDRVVVPVRGTPPAESRGSTGAGGRRLAKP